MQPGLRVLGQEFITLLSFFVAFHGTNMSDKHSYPLSGIPPLWGAIKLYVVKVLDDNL